MEPFVPYRLTQNRPGEFTYVTSGLVNEIGYRVRDQNSSEGPYDNAFVFLNGLDTVRLSNIDTPNRFARHVGRFGNRFVVSEQFSVGAPPTGSNVAVNLLLRDGQTSLPVTHNAPGFAASAFFLDGEFLFANSEYTAPTQTTPFRTDLYHYTSVGSMNLTNNPPFARSSRASGSQAGSLFIITNYDNVQPQQSNLLFSTLNGAPAVPVTQTVPGQTILNSSVYRGGGVVMFELLDGTVSPIRADVVAFDGSATTNLTVNPPGVIGRFSTRAADDVIIRQESGNTPANARADLLRYHNGVVTRLTDNPPGTQSYVVDTIGPTILFHTGTNSNELSNGVSNLFLNDGGTNVPLTHNSTGMQARFERVGGYRTIEITDYRNGILPNAVRSNLYLLDGIASISLSSNPLGVHVGRLYSFADKFAFTTDDYRAGASGAERATDLYLFDGIGAHRLSTNPPGTHSTAAGPAGVNFAFHTSVHDASIPGPRLSDLMLFDGTSVRNLTNLQPRQYANFQAMLGSDLLVLILDQTGGTQTSQALTNLFRYTIAGDRVPITQNGPGTVLSVMDIREDRAIWYEQTAGSITRFLSGDGLSPNDILFQTPPGQTMRQLPSWRDIEFFSLEGESGEQSFSNIFACLGGEVRQLTDNGPGWLAKLYLPIHGLYRNPPDAIVPEVAIIELTTPSGDRRDVTVVWLPEPVAACVILFAFVWKRRRR